MARTEQRDLLTLPISEARRRVAQAAALLASAAWLLAGAPPGAAPVSEEDFLICGSLIEALRAILDAERVAREQGLAVCESAPDKAERVQLLAELRDLIEAWHRAAEELRATFAALLDAADDAMHPAFIRLRELSARNPKVAEALRDAYSMADFFDDRSPIS